MCNFASVTDALVVSAFVIERRVKDTATLDLSDSSSRSNAFYAVPKRMARERRFLVRRSLVPPLTVKSGMSSDIHDIFLLQKKGKIKLPQAAIILANPK